MEAAVGVVTGLARAPAVASVLQRNNRLLEPLLPLLNPVPGLANAPSRATAAVQAAALQLVSVVAVCRADGGFVLRRRFCAALMVRLIMLLDSALAEAEAADMLEQEDAERGGKEGGATPDAPAVVMMQRGVSLLSMLIHISAQGAPLLPRYPADRLC